MGTIVVRQAGGNFPSISPLCSENPPHALLLVACHQSTRLGRLVLNGYLVVTSRAGPFSGPRRGRSWAAATPRQGKPRRPRRPPRHPRGTRGPPPSWPQ